MSALPLAFFIVTFVLFIIEGIRSPPNLIAWGLASLTLAFILSHTFMVHV